MRKPFDGDFKLTQAFNDACCRASYAKFNLKGHNGLDYGLPNGTKVVAPHEGKVIEATLDPKGYGLYLKIENAVEGSLLAHLREFKVGVGDTVSEGQLVGLSNNSGNSTGPHLHWGYYRFPRDRSNGFNGYIDQIPFINATVPDQTLAQCRVELETVKKQVQDEITKKNETYQELQEVKSDLEGKNSQILSYENFQKQLAITLNVEPDQAKILGAIVKSNEMEDQLRQSQKKVEELQQSIATCNSEYDLLKEKLEESINKNKADSDLLQRAIDKNKEWEGLYKKLEKAYEDLKEDQKYDYKHLGFGLYYRKKL